MMKFSGGIKRQLWGAAALPLLLCCQQAVAQEQSSAEPMQVETVVVTAQKHAESVQTTPLAITAFDENSLKAKGMTRATDVVAEVPNASFSSMFGEGQNPSFCFRSICLTGQFGDGFEPPVAMYTDEVYAGAAFAQSLQFFDVQRIEVLKGPQGTLYGRNTTGGLFNVILNKPTRDFEASLSGEYGSYNNMVFEGMISGPITDKIQGRIAFQTHNRDGWVKGTDDNGQEANDVNTQAVRGMLNFDLSPDATLLLSANYFHVDQGPQAYGVYGTVDSDGSTCSISKRLKGNCSGLFGDNTTTNEVVGSAKPDKWIGVDIPGGVKARNFVEDYSLSATLDWNVDGIALKSISAYNIGHKLIVEDLDGSVNYQYDDELWAHTKTFSQEIRASGSALGDDINWITGIFYYNDSRNLGTNLFPDTYYKDWSSKNIRSWAAYANADITLPYNLTLTTGVRYSWEHLGITFSRSGEYVDAASNERRGTTNGNIDGKVSLKWQPTDSTMLYSSFTTGYRSANVITQYVYGTIDKGASDDVLQPAKPEKLYAYEVGSKSDLLDRRLRFNSSMFFYNFHNKQQSLYTLDCDIKETCSGHSRMRNIKKSYVWGAELSAEAILTDDLMANGAFGYTDSKVMSHEEDGDQLALHGTKLPMSGMNGNVGMTYHLPLNTSYGNFKLRVDYDWMGHHSFSGGNDIGNYDESKAYGLTNVNLSWDTPSDNIRMEFFVKNLGDVKYYVDSAELATTTEDVVWGMPRTFGIRLTYNH